MNMQREFVIDLSVSQGYILTIYAKEGCRQSPEIAFAHQQEQLLFLLTPHGCGSETPLTLLWMAAAVPSQVCRRL